MTGRGAESEGEYKSGESELDDDDDDNKETSEKSGKYAYPEVAKEWGIDFGFKILKSHFISCLCLYLESGGNNVVSRGDKLYTNSLCAVVIQVKNKKYLTLVLGSKGSECPVHL